jgi:hypothetical protein
MYLAYVLVGRPKVEVGLIDVPRWPIQPQRLASRRIDLDESQVVEPRSLQAYSLAARPSADLNRG